MTVVDEHAHGGVRILGIEIRVRPSWLILAVLLAWSLATGAFPELYKGLPTSTYWAVALIVVAGLAVSIILHEMAHSLVARAYGLPIDRITLFLLGGVAELRREPKTPQSELLMALAGPLFSLAFGLALMALSQGMTPAGDALGLAAALDYLAMINVVLAVFNMIPAYPTDGGRALRAVLWMITGSAARATGIAAAVSGGFAIALMIAGVALALTGQVAGGLWWVMIGLFLRTAAQSSVSDMMAERLLAGRPISRLMAVGAGPLAADMTVAAYVEHQAYAPPQALRAVVSDGVTIGVVEAADILALPRESWPNRTLAQACRPLGPGCAVEAGADAQSVFEQMKQERSRRVIVLDRGRPVGVVALQDLLQRLDMGRLFDRNRRSTGR